MFLMVISQDAVHKPKNCYDFFLVRLNAVNQTFQKKSWLGDKEEGGIRGRYGGRVEG